MKEFARLRQQRFTKLHTSSSRMNTAAATCMRSFGAVKAASATTDCVNADLACGSCSRRLSEMRGPCLMCGRDSDGVRRDVERRVEQLLRLRAALLASTHIYASYEGSLVEQELRGYGIDLDDHPPVPPEAGAPKKRR